LRAEAGVRRQDGGGVGRATVLEMWDGDAGELTAKIGA
jgi:hypothetical protein